MDFQKNQTMLKKKKQKENINVIPTVSIKVNKEQCQLIIDSLLLGKDFIDDAISLSNENKQKDLKEIDDLLNHIKNS